MALLDILQNYRILSKRKSYGRTESPAHSFTHYHYILCGLYFNIILISLSSTPILSETEYPLRTVCFTALPWDAKLPQLFPPEGTFSFILGLTRKKFPQVFPFHLHFALFASPRGTPRSPPQIPPNPPSFSEGLKSSTIPLTFCAAISKEKVSEINDFRDFWSE